MMLSSEIDNVVKLINDGMWRWDIEIAKMIVQISLEVKKLRLKIRSMKFLINAIFIILETCGNSTWDQSVVERKIKRECRTAWDSIPWWNN